MQGRTRHVLLLQGPCSWFFAVLGQALRARGADVTRVLLCPGDRLFWRGPGAVWYKGQPENWSDFVTALARDRGITDMVCLGDGRAWHREAIASLRPAGVRVHVVEQGYLRPGWLTVEPDGTGGNTRFPNDPARIVDLARVAPEAVDRRFRQSFWAFSAMDVGFSLANILFSWLVTPHYRSHYLDSPLKEWAGWIGKGLRWPGRAAGRQKALRRIATHDGPIFLFPLQLETDFQIRNHGADPDLKTTLRRVLASFIAKASPDSILVIKPHPLDNGWTPWRAVLDAVSNPRLVWLDGGSLDDLLPRLSGLVTVNSTVGMTALQASVPVVALGQAIYRVPGLTHSGDLGSFWHEPTSPDAGLVDALKRALAATIQVPGNFDGSGVAAGVEGVAAKILARDDPFQGQSAPENSQGVVPYD